MALAISALLIHAASAPEKTKSVSLSFPPIAGEPVGKWDGNALLTVENHSSTAPILHISDQSGQEIQRIMLQVPGAYLIKVLNNRFARSDDGYVAIGGTAYGNDRGAGFLAIIAPDGSHQSLVRTEPYVPYAVAFASDGNIWTAGLENDADGTAKGLVDYFMVRRFDRQGRVLGGTLSRMAFSTPYAPVDLSVLVSSPDRVGWFVPTAHRYIEFSLNGSKISDYTIDVPEVGFEGATLCQNNTFWVSFHQSD